MSPRSTALTADSDCCGSSRPASRASVAPSAVGLLFTALAAVAALQTSVAWHRVGHDDDRLVAGGAAALAGLASLAGTSLAGIAILIGVVVSIAAAATAAERVDPVLVRAGCTVRTWLFPALAVVSVVAITREDLGAFVILLVLVSALRGG